MANPDCVSEQDAISKAARSREAQLKRTTILLKELNEKLYLKRIGRRIFMCFADNDGSPDFEASPPTIDQRFHEFGWGRVHEKWQIYHMTGVYGEPETFNERPLMETSIRTRVAFVHIVPMFIEKIEQQLITDVEQLERDLDALQNILDRL